MEKKYAVMRVTQNGKDRLVIQEAILNADASLSEARSKITQRVKAIYTSPTWIGWVDEITQLTIMIQN